MLIEKTKDGGNKKEWVMDGTARVINPIDKLFFPEYVDGKR